MPVDVQTVLANEARRLEIKTKLANTAGATDVLIKLIDTAANLKNTAVFNAGVLQAELTELEAGAGPGVTADFGKKSAITQFVEDERWAAKSASVDFIKANPLCTEAEAAEAWDTAAVAAHPNFPLPIQGGLALGRLYRANLLQAGAIAENTWEAQRQWIIDTPKEVILAA